jgi:predicted RNase H-like nuclease (RuvC/YqgF family)
METGGDSEAPYKSEIFASTEVMVTVKTQEKKINSLNFQIQKLKAHNSYLKTEFTTYRQTIQKELTYIKEYALSQNNKEMSVEFASLEQMVGNLLTQL